ncbi:AAA family ATPase [Flavobacterium sp. SM2513]|uniref:AAA family ATPase n=1 Tax=Flavobacterium sp. SM2513 TaxID=3424766 RepID=UPI003D7F65C3
MKSCKSDFTINKKSFSENELTYWKKFGIDESVLAKFNVSSISEYTTKNKEGKPYVVSANPNKFIFAYENKNWVKLYKPLDDKKYRFQYLGIKEQGFIFGWKQLPAKGDLVIITGGEKDVMALHAKNYNAITLNSETAVLSETTVDELKSRFVAVMVLYDNDATGVEQSSKLAKKHGLQRLVLPPLQNAGKDISDYFASGRNSVDFYSLILASLQILAMEIATDKVVFNAKELLERGEVEQKYLLEPIFPQKGSAVLAGKPDTGKSQFARQLCIQVALGVDSFIDFNLTTVHHRAIYVATEDNEDATRYLISKQFKGLNSEAVENLRFIFADTMSTDEIIKNLNEQLTLQPVDLVVIDSFGDVFQSNDSNNNIAMRNTVKTFDKIGKDHNCLILFVHHINKAAYRVAPGQEHIQGGAGLVQKVRLAIILSEGEGDIRYFTVVKGNYCPKIYKENSLELNFSEETFLFSNTGKLIPTHELGNQTAKDAKDERHNDLKVTANTIFGDKLLSFTTFVTEYCAVTKKSTATAKRAHANLVKYGIIEQFNGVYRLKDYISEDREETDVTLSDCKTLQSSYSGKPSDLEPHCDLPF